MAKKRTPEQEAFSRAMRRPERKWFVGRCMAFARGNRPTEWSFFTNWRGFSIGIGAVDQGDAKDKPPKSVLLVSLDWRPFGFVIWWRSKRLIWIGDWEWKKSLRNG